VQKFLPERQGEQAGVAAKLAMSARTLSRRLADEGATYEEVVSHRP
jgi:hypothetical protein